MHAFCGLVAIASLQGVWGRDVRQQMQANGTEPIDLQSAYARRNLPCNAPVQRAPVHFPDSLLAGDAKDHARMYSGYINVTSEDYLFYWFVEAEEGAPASAPIVVWSNGGPGCSAMEGATTEIGPLKLHLVGTSRTKLFSGRFSRNAYAWNQRAHLLFVDQPRYVGYSCGTGKRVTSSVEAGQDMVTFLRGWRTQFQEHASSGFILASESYGGKYVPAWTSAILDFNAQPSTSEPLQLVGIALGNAVINETIQNGKTFIEYAKKEKLLNEGDHPRTEDQARALIEKRIGYEPNYYDYRLKEAKQWLLCPDCNSYDYTTYSQFLMKEEVTTALNVCGNSGKKSFGRGKAGCIDMPGFDKHDHFHYSAALARALELRIPVVLFYGMQDTAVNYVGGHAVASTLEWTGASSFDAAPLEDIKIAGAIVGKKKSVAGFTWMQIHGSGHMVPNDSPAAAYMALDTLLSDRQPNLV